MVIAADRVTVIVKITEAEGSNEENDGGRGEGEGGKRGGKEEG